MASVDLRAVSKVFEQTQVLHDINLTVEDGEFMVLVGPSGCGKSTLLRIIAGLESISSGEIRLENACVNHLPPKARDIAMVFQSYALYPHMTVYDNLAFGLRRQQQYRLGEKVLGGLLSNRRAIDQRVQEVALTLQLENLLTRKPKELSGGQKQRVALGRAMARNPKVFLMDEPLSNLDAQLRGETRSQIVQLQKKLQATTVYVTHDQTEAMTMGSRIAVLRGGKIQQVDTPLNLYRRPANCFVAGFIGSPSMNFFPALVDEEGLVQSPWLSQPIALSEQQRQLLTPRRPLTLGIRPEHVRPASLAEAHIQAIIRVVEALGCETNVVMELQPGNGQGKNQANRQPASQPLQAKVSPDVHFSVNETCGWVIDPSNMYLFDQESGDVLMHP
jgi:multiple sugar transport system ATP-binding protein